MIARSPGGCLANLKPGIVSRPKPEFHLSFDLGSMIGATTWARNALTQGVIDRAVF